MQKEGEKMNGDPYRKILDSISGLSEGQSASNFYIGEVISEDDDEIKKVRLGGVIYTGGNDAQLYKLNSIELHKGDSVALLPYFDMQRVLIIGKVIKV
ncbi:MAG: hypothetical protein LKJ25_03060 [Clostridia bacterium]|nr:hypothetical protein [Clostridia bacterium]